MTWPPHGNHPVSVIQVVRRKPPGLFLFQHIQKLLNRDLAVWSYLAPLYPPCSLVRPRLLTQPFKSDHVRIEFQANPSHVTQQHCLDISLMTLILLVNGDQCYLAGDIFQEQE